MKRRDNPSDSLSPDFLDFIACLNQAGVEYVLVGAHALAVHGIVRATGDMDFLFRPVLANVERLCSALTEFGAPSAVIDMDALLDPNVVTQFGNPPSRIDLLSAIDGVSFDEVWQGSVLTTLPGLPLRVIGRKELEKTRLQLAD